MNPRLALAVARLTLRETARRRILWVLLGLSITSVALTGWGVERLVALARDEGIADLQVRIGVSQVLILIAFMFSFVLAMSGAFLAAPAIASDVESGTVLAVLARPIHRADLVVGRWIGLSLVVVGYTVVSGALAIGVVRLVSGHAPPEPQVALAFLALQALIVLTLALALGTRLPGIAAGAISVAAFGLAWFAGVLGAIATLFQVAPLAGGTEIVRMLMPTDLLWRGVVYGLEPPIVLFATAGRSRQVLQANPFFADAPPPPELVAWSLAWIGLMLVAGIVLFRRREL